jgi:hypothetical protein
VHTGASEAVHRALGHAPLDVVRRSEEASRASSLDSRVLELEGMNDLSITTDEEEEGEDGRENRKGFKDRLKTGSSSGSRIRGWFGKRTTSEPAPFADEELTTADRVQHALADWHNSHGNSPAASEKQNGFEDSPEPTHDEISDALDNDLGHWRFSDPALDLVEDNSFIHLDRSLTVAQRRRYFADVNNRKHFVYHPDVCVLLLAEGVTDSCD